MWCHLCCKFVVARIVQSWTSVIVCVLFSFLTWQQGRYCEL